MKQYKRLILLLFVFIIGIPLVFAQGVPNLDYDPYAGIGILAFTNVMVFIIIFWLINNQRINVEKFIQKYQENAPQKVTGAIKVEFVVKNAGILAICILNLIISGMLYHAWTEVEVVGERLIGLFFVMNVIIIFTILLIMVVQVFYFPFSFVKESAMAMNEKFKER